MTLPTIERPAAAAAAPDRSLTFALSAALLAVLHAWSLHGSGPLDDDYIMYRYAANLVAGDGLVFNAGERI